jgi:multidrug efflux pump subunit AcrB
MVQLHSFQRLFLVLSVVPLGMIAKNVVILIGQIDAERAQGKGVWETIDASSSRFRPIMLTAVSTVLGMIPIAPTVFWGPMAFAIMGGLLVATILTLIFLPTLHVA